MNSMVLISNNLPFIIQKPLIILVVSQNDRTFFQLVDPVTK